MPSTTTDGIQQDYITCEGCTVHSITTALSLVKDYAFKGKQLQLCLVCQELADLVLRRSSNSIATQSELLIKIRRIRKDYIRFGVRRHRKPKFQRKSRFHWEKS
jgi:hypothetical protein